jgi:hypothetical protein
MGLFFVLFGTLQGKMCSMGNEDGRHVNWKMVVMVKLQMGDIVILSKGMRLF